MDALIGAPLFALVVAPLYTLVGAPLLVVSAVGYFSWRDKHVS
jgi:hypothetical protein